MELPPTYNEENSAKIPALALLSTLGYQYIAPSECSKMRRSLSSIKSNKAGSNTAYSNTNSLNTVILPDVLRDVLSKKTFLFMGKERALSDESIDKIIADLSSPAMNEGLNTANEKLYNVFTHGKSIHQFIDGKKANPTIALIDWETPANNQFHVTEEFVVNNVHGTSTIRPDIVCFVNGLPWVVIEAKYPSNKSANKSTIKEGISQTIRNQKHDQIPHLFAYNQLVLSINGNDGRYGTCGTKDKFWAKWKEEQIDEATFKQLKNTHLSTAQLEAMFAHKPAKLKQEYLSLIQGGELVVTDQDRLLISLLRPDRLFEMTRLFTLFDKKYGKIVARYQQAFGIKALVERITTFDDTLAGKRKGARAGGVIWHTTGSGKSFTMVFLSKALVWLKELAKCRVIVVTDRVDLETQLSNTFASGGALDDKDKASAKASSGTRLAEQIGKGNERIIFSIINKFSSAIKLPECYNDSADIIVLIDEGHRTQNGEHNVHMQQSLPKAAFVAFTGTPLLKDDKTENKFGSIIHSYTMQQAVDDKTVTPLLYEERVPNLDTDDDAIDTWFDRFTEQFSENQRSDLKRKFARKGAIYQTEGRQELIAHDISDHFQNFKNQGLKGQLACDSKASAVVYKNLLDKIGKVTSAIVFSAPDTREGHASVDEDLDAVQGWWKANVELQYSNDEKKYTKAIVDAFATEDGPDLLIVVDKLLTGFDEPSNTVLYIDKPLKQHNLIQAIARVNRLHDKKKFGYLIDYRGVLKELDASIEGYQELENRVKGGFDREDLSGLYQRMETEYIKLPSLYKDLWAVFAGVENKKDSEALSQALMPKITTIDDMLTDTNLKKREDFYAALTAFANCLKVALQSANYFEDPNFKDKHELYKITLKNMSKIRAKVREATEETINYDEYEKEIRQMLDKHIDGVEIKESKGAYLVTDLGKKESDSDKDSDKYTEKEASNRHNDIEQLPPEKIRAEKDKITGRLAKTIEQKLADDPYAQEHFSKLLKQAIEEAEEMFDAPFKQYLLFADLEEKVQQRYVDTLPMDRFAPFTEPKQRAQIQAFYGLIEQNTPSVELAEEAHLNFAIEIERITQEAIDTYSINPPEIENQITKNLLVHGVTKMKMPMDEVKALTDEVLKNIRLSLAGYKS